MISNGVLHHTSDPFRAFQSIAKLVKPNGYLLVGLYHRYGRLITDFRRLVFRFTRDRLTVPRPQSANSGDSRRAKQPRLVHGSVQAPARIEAHDRRDARLARRKIGFRFVSSVPRSKPFQPFGDADNLFRPEEPGNALERWMVELGMTFRGSREGGFFVVTARRDPDAQKSV